METVVSHFERLWLEGAGPSLDAFLATLGAEQRRRALAELAHVDLEFRLKAGQQARVEEYLQRFPELDEPEVVRALVATAHRHRRGREEGLSLAEYAARFPHLALDLEEVRSAAQTVVEGARPKDRSTPDGTSAFPALPGYEVLSDLGHGGMGVVYRARQVWLQRLVALKMIRSGVPDRQQCERFLAEAQAAARLHHPHMVQVYEVGEHEGRPYVALELVDGGMLSERFARNPLDALQAAALLETVARAVHHAHEQGIVHRDLKPCNVLLTADGTPKVADFGLAKKLDEAGQTQSGAIVGTPSYMAPEQAAGKGKALGPAADVYALGAILYEALVGRPPFRAATSLETLRQILDDEPVPPRRLQPRVPRDLETICLKCLHKEPHRRYAMALELAEDLRRLLAGEPIRARPVGPVERALKWARRRPALALLLLVIGLGMLGSVVAVATFAQYLRTALAQRTNELQDEQALREQEAAQRQREREEAALKRQQEAGRTNAVLNFQRALDFCRRGEVSLARQSLDQIDGRHVDLGIFAYRFLARQCDRQLPDLGGVSRRSVAFSRMAPCWPSRMHRASGSGACRTGT
jgi:hypothetical protein